MMGLQYRPRQLGQLLELLREDEVVRAHGLCRGPRRRRHTTCSVDAHACIHTAAVPRTNPPREHHLRSGGEKKNRWFLAVPCRVGAQVESDIESWALERCLWDWLRVIARSEQK